MEWTKDAVVEYSCLGDWVVGKFLNYIIHNFSIFQNVLFQVKINILLLPTPRSLVLMKSSDVS